MFVAVLACAAVEWTVGPARAAHTPVFGGATYNTTTNTGFAVPNPIFVGNGVAVAQATKNQNNASLGVGLFRYGPDGATELGTFGGDVSLRGINLSGVAVGYSKRIVNGQDLGDRAARWDPGQTQPVELQGLGFAGDGSATSRAFAIGPTGAIVGLSYKYVEGAFVGIRPVRWEAGSTTAVELQSLGGESGAYAINANGLAAGFSYTPAGTRAVRWMPGSTAPVELELLDKTGAGNARFSAARGVNLAGTTVGFAYKSNPANPGTPDYHAVRWDANTTSVTELGTLGTMPDGGSSSIADGINDTGTTFGSSQRYVNGVAKGERATIWRAGQTEAVELAHLGTDANGFTASRAYAQNQAGLLAGHAYSYGATSPVGYRAVVWDDTGAVLDLNTLIDPAAGWTLRFANAISDTNWVAGLGDFDPDLGGPRPAYARAFLLQVPEPTSLAGLAVLGLLRRCRRTG